MASTYSTNLALDLMANGDQSGTWGTTTNTNLGTLIEQAISGYVTQAITDGSGANTTITIPNGTTGVARNMFIEMTGALTFSTTSLIVPANKKMYFIFNNTSGGFAVTVKVSGQTGILVPNGKKVILTSNGTDIVEAHTAIVGNATMGGTLGITGTTTAAAINASGTVAMAGAATVGTTLGVTGTSTMAAINASGLVTINKGSTGEHLVVGFPGTPLYHIGNDGTYAYITTSASAFGTGVLSTATQMYLTVNNAATLGLTATAATVTGTLSVTGAAAFGGAVSTVAQTKLTGSWTGSGDAYGLEINHALTATSTNNILGVYVHQTVATASVNHVYIDGMAIDPPSISGTGTVTNANTLRIGGAPTISGGGTITNAKALWVTSGATQLDGTLGVTGVATFNNQTNISKNATQGEIQLAVNWAYGVIIYEGGAVGANGAATVLVAQKNSSTGRSINAAGTINASGADYAEYERKSSLSTLFAKGDIVGFDKDGLLTNSKAVTYGVKSTNPSYVGGDVWGDEESIGKRPNEPKELLSDASESEKEKYEKDVAEFPALLDAFEAKLDAARQWVDRVAYCGKTPVNVTGATPGEFIVADNGGEVWDLTADATVPDWFKKYLRTVGRVRRILPDGRAEIAVYVH